MTGIDLIIHLIPTGRFIPWGIVFQYAEKLIRNLSNIYDLPSAIHK